MEFVWLVIWARAVYDKTRASKMFLWKCFRTYCMYSQRNIDLWKLLSVEMFGSSVLWRRSFITCTKVPTFGTCQRCELCCASLNDLFCLCDLISGKKYFLVVNKLNTVVVQQDQIGGIWSWHLRSLYMLLVFYGLYFFHRTFLYYK